MRNKCLLIILALLVAVSGLAGCGAGATAVTPTSSPPKTGSAAPSTPPNPTPAIFKLSNLRAIPAPDNIANLYIFLVDVENDGGNSGMFTGYYQVDNGNRTDESSPTLISPGKKKSIELTGPQQDIQQLGQAYDSGATDEKQHVVKVGDLSITITLADRFKLKIISDDINAASDNVIVSGQVQNVSNEKLDHLSAVVAFLRVDYSYIATAKAPIAVDSLEAGQTLGIYRDDERRPFNLHVPYLFRGCKRQCCPRHHDKRAAAIALGRYFARQIKSKRDCRNSNPSFLVIVGRT